MAEQRYECTEVAIPSFGWPPGRTERTAMSHAFVDADGVRPGTRCQCGRAVVGDDGMPIERADIVLKARTKPRPPNDKDD